MAHALLKFRCYNCAKLLGVSATKAGHTTTCPNCKADLIVPDPAEPEIDEAVRAIVPVVEEPPPKVAPAPSPSPSPRSKAEPKHEPGFTWEEIDTALFQSAARAEPVFEPVPEPPAAPRADPEPIEPQPGSTPEPAPSPIAPGAAIGIAVEVPVDPIRPERLTAPRRGPGEVVLSQGVLASWSLFVLLALAIAFIAGLFVGHYVWKGV